MLVRFAKSVWSSLLRSKYLIVIPTKLMNRPSKDGDPTEMFSISPRQLPTDRPTGPD